MAWTLCTSGAAITKAGVNANATIVASGAALSNWSDEAESIVCDIARSDVVTNFASLTTNGKQVFQDYCSSHIAQKIAIYDPLGYSSEELNIILNVLENNISNAEKLIRDDKNKTYMGVT